MRDKIDKLCQDGMLNNYMRDRLYGIDQTGLTESVSDTLTQDACDASCAGVRNDNAYNTYFFVVRFAKDMLKDTFGIDVDQDKIKELCHFCINNNDYKFDNLIDFRLMMHKWLCDGISKYAYPNIGGKDNREKIFDLGGKWIPALKSIFNTMHTTGVSKQLAINKYTFDWDIDERNKFNNWMRYYEENNTEKYNVKTSKLHKRADVALPQSWEKSNDSSLNISTYKEEKTERERNRDLAIIFKKKMQGRIRSLRRLIERFNDILPRSDVSGVINETHNLDKSIRSLNTYASMVDCVIRSSNKIRKMGFGEGADLLKIAAEPELNSGVIDMIPDAPSSMPGTETSSANLSSVISRLEDISKVLKSRNVIRDLAGIDILLNNMGLASLFVEISDAQSKLIDGFGYASNKIEGAIAKLRGVGSSNVSAPANVPVPITPLDVPEPIITPPIQMPREKPIETGEMLTKPVGKVKKELPKVK